MTWSNSLGAMAEPRRRAILELVAEAELPAGKIAEHFDVTRAAVSQHLRVLKDAGLVEERAVGTRRLYRASPESLQELRQYLDGLWASSLAFAKNLVETETGTAADERSEAG